MVVSSPSLASFLNRNKWPACIYLYSGQNPDNSPQREFKGEKRFTGCLYPRTMVFVLEIETNWYFGEKKMCLILPILEIEKNWCPAKQNHLNKVTQRVKGLVLEPSVLIGCCYVTNIHKSRQIETSITDSHAQTCKLARACWLRGLFSEGMDAMRAHCTNRFQTFSYIRIC